MSTDTKDTSTRSKLTLKLKLPSSSDPKSLALKNAENKRISNSLVQVTIKGRKKDSSATQSAQNLNNNEFEARKKALRNSSNEEEYQADKFDVLSKI